MTRAALLELLTWLSDLESQLAEFGEVAEASGMPLEVETKLHAVGLSAGRLTALAVEAVAGEVAR